MTKRHPRRPPGRAARVSYALLGLLAGALWLWNAGQPPWLHAARILAVLLVVPALSRRLAVATARRRGRAARQFVSIRHVMAMKAVLVILAMVATMLLADRVAGLAWYVAALLALAIGLGGPQFQRLTARAARPPDAGTSELDASRAAASRGL